MHYFVNNYHDDCECLHWNSNLVSVEHAQWNLLRTGHFEIAIHFIFFNDIGFYRTIYNGGVSVELTSRYWWRVHLHTTFLPIILFLYCMVPEWVIWVSDVISGIKYRQDIFYPYMITHEFIRFAMKHMLDPDLLHILQSGKFHFATCWNLYGKLEVPKGTSEPVKRKSWDTIKSKRKIWQKHKQRSTKHYTENYWLSNNVLANIQ